MAEDSETKHGGNKNGKKEGVSGSSFFTWFMVIALLGVWTSVAVVWFELVDYEEVLAKAKDFRYNLSEVLQGKLGIYDADGDGDFDVEDAKVLLGKYTWLNSIVKCLTKDGSNENIDSLEEVLNILAEESSDWFYGFISFLYDVMTPFEIIEEEESDAADDIDGESPGGVIKRKAKVKVKEIKEPVKKVKEKQEPKKETKDEEKKKTKKKIEDFDIKDKKVTDDKSKKESDKVKRDRRAEKERSGLDKNVKNKEIKESASGKDKEIKKIAKRLSKSSDSSAKEEEKRKKVK
ncbi:hypothetical protein JD844_016162 [Phrynosoma platyrhinos]|uniref:Aspartyl beta-hydroxylase/Triadin domain-containing protein n=1 Tax=Phrynosoma platyrhinos TaxID=52577 RepID=A0ABQ7SK25_PHRPL|nr:hypothetical protein JD844_016162 [Phrynosoma platyrhinos]